MDWGGAGAALSPLGCSSVQLWVATKQPARRSESGERMFETDWTPVEAWDKLAVQCTRYLHKGSRVRMVACTCNPGKTVRQGSAASRPLCAPRKSCSWARQELQERRRRDGHCSCCTPATQA